MLSAAFAVSAAGAIHQADIAYDGDWRRFRIDSDAVAEAEADVVAWAPGIPVEIHCHSIGDVDFSDFPSMDLLAVEAAAAREGVLCVPTLYLPYSRYEPFLGFMRRFDEARRAGLIPHLPGVALEGPLLASFGGTPEQGVWAPTYDEWRALAACGPLGLTYVVLSPDADAPASHLVNAMTPGAPTLDWIVSTLVEAGVRPAFGHFTRADPVRSAGAVDHLLDVAESAGARRGYGDVVTDHLFNDMPLRFTHAFRTAEARQRRDEEIRKAQLDAWSFDTLDELAGPVPTAIMRAAKEGRLKACVNFDGAHVDHAIVARALELVGVENIMLMTDRSDVARLGGQALYHTDENTLWYQDKGIVAAGSQAIDRQMRNARSIGLDIGQVWQVATLTAWRVLHGAPPNGDVGCFLATDERLVVKRASRPASGDAAWN